MAGVCSYGLCCFYRMVSLCLCMRENGMQRHIIKKAKFIWTMNRYCHTLGKLPCIRMEQTFAIKLIIIKQTALTVNNIALLLGEFFDFDEVVPLDCSCLTLKLWRAHGIAFLCILQ